MANQQKSWLTNLITTQISGSSTNLREIWMLPSLSTDTIILKEYIIIAEYSVELRYSSSRTITVSLFIAEDVRCPFVQSTAVCWISAMCQVLSRCWGYAVDLYQSICTRCWNIELCSYQLLPSVFVSFHPSPLWWVQGRHMKSPWSPHLVHPSSVEPAPMPLLVPCQGGWNPSKKDVTLGGASGTPTGGNLWSPWDSWGCDCWPQTGLPPRWPHNLRSRWYYWLIF